MCRLNGRAIAGVTLLWCLVGCVVGCGESSGPKVEYVEGIVTLDGQPVEGATVGFSPVSQSGVAAIGTTDAQGVYRLTAMPVGAVDKGAVAGDYTVTLEKMAPPVNAPIISEEDPNYGKESAKGSDPPQAAPVTHLIPPKYNSATTSGLKVTVKPGTNKGDAFNFNIKKE